jgi:hypothetical protein
LPKITYRKKGAVEVAETMVEKRGKVEEKKIGVKDG